MQANYPWFSHDADARNSRKLRMLRASFGNEGYAKFFILLEILRAETEYRLNLNEEATRSFVLMELSAEQKDFDKFVNYCTKIHLFEFQDGFLWSEGLRTRMLIYDAKRDQLRRNGMKGGRPKAFDNQMLTKRLKKANQNHKQK